MWRRRAALLVPVALVAALPVALSRGDAAEAGPAQPLVLDLDLTPNPVCSGARPGRGVPPRGRAVAC
jgi:hypothetical protein